MTATLYDVLGAPRVASRDELHRAYRRRAAALHPDLHAGDPSAEEAMRAVNAAWAVLGDPDERRAYDRSFLVPSAGDLDTDDADPADRAYSLADAVPNGRDTILQLFLRFHPVRWGLAAFMVVALLVIFVATAYMGTGATPR